MSVAPDERERFGFECFGGARKRFASLDEAKKAAEDLLVARVWTSWCRRRLGGHLCRKSCVWDGVNPSFMLEGIGSCLGAAHFFLSLLLC